MFGMRGMSFAKNALKFSTFASYKPVVHLPKAEMTVSMLSATSLLNPNVMKLVNLRELILKSKSEVESANESIEGIVNLSTLTHLISNTSLNKAGVGDDVHLIMSIISLDSDGVGLVQPLDL